MMGITVNPTGAGSHVPVVERKIKQVKEKVRVSTSTIEGEYISPRESFQGVKADFKRELSLSYGQYCEVHKQPFITNTMKSRTRPRTSLNMKGNRQNSWYFYMLDTDKLVSRDHWTAMPTPNWVIQQIIAKAIARERQINRLHVFKYEQRALELNDDVDITAEEVAGAFASSRRPWRQYRGLPPD
eukprot:gene13615-28917_t